MGRRFRLYFYLLLVAMELDWVYPGYMKTCITDTDKDKEDRR